MDISIPLLVNKSIEQTFKNKKKNINEENIVTEEDDFKLMISDNIVGVIVAEVAMRKHLQKGG